MGDQRSTIVPEDADCMESLPGASKVKTDVCAELQEPLLEATGSRNYPSDWPDNGETVLFNMLRRFPQLTAAIVIKHMISHKYHGGKVARALAAEETRAKEAAEEAHKQDVRDRIKAEFAKLDVDGDGRLLPLEMRVLLDRLGWQFTSETTISKVFSSIDRDHSGFVEFDEFIDWAFATTEEKIKKEFDKSDWDGAGRIAIGEMIEVLARIGWKRPREVTWEKVFASIDKDNSGYIEFNELVDWAFANSISMTIKSWPELNISISLTSGEVVWVGALPGDLLISELIRRVAAATCQPASKLRLRHGHRQLPCSEKLGTVGISDFATLTAIVLENGPTIDSSVRE